MISACLVAAFGGKNAFGDKIQHASVGACVGARGELGFRHQLARFVHFARYNFADLARLLASVFWALSMALTLLSSPAAFASASSTFNSHIEAV